MQTIKVLSGIAALGLASISLAATLDVPIRAATEDGAGANLGTVHIEETRYGLVFTPHLTGLPPGIHGFHVHEKGSCDPSVKDGKVTPAGQAGGHFDPDKTGKHLGPYGDGHLGDLPALYVGADGMAMYPVLAPRLTRIDQIKGHALMVHAGGDNHSDEPMPLGGGGARYACGVI
ncbi:superoxide dismutase family protein [Silvimonas sp. JCM 19000]